MARIRHPLPPGKAAERDYLTMAANLADEARDADRHERPLTARILREKARIARAAALAEEIDPEPKGLGS